MHSSLNSNALGSVVTKAIFILSLVVLCLTVSSVNPAFALSSKNLTGSCKTEYRKWLKHGGYGAFVFSRAGICAWNWDSSDLESAKSSALKKCQGNHRKNQGCQVIDTTAISDKLVKRNAECDADKPGDAADKIMACTLLIESGEDHGAKLSWDYNERGRNYDINGKVDAAIADYSRVIALDKNDPAAYMNRAILRKKRGEIDAALEDGRTAMRLQKKYGGKLRTDPKEFLKELEQIIETDEVEPIIEEVEPIYEIASASQLCVSALNSEKSDWDYRPEYASKVKLAKKSGLQVPDCRKALGYQMFYNRFESYGALELCTASKYYLKLGKSGFADFALTQLEWQRRNFSDQYCEYVTQHEALNKIAGALEAVNKVQRPIVLEADDIVSVTQLCTSALNADKTDWEKSPKFASKVQLANERGLNLPNCRKMLGYQEDYNRFESYGALALCRAHEYYAKAKNSTSPDPASVQSEWQRRTFSDNFCEYLTKQEKADKDAQFLAHRTPPKSNLQAKGSLGIDLPVQASGKPYLMGKLVESPIIESSSIPKIHPQTNAKIDIASDYRLAKDVGTIEAFDAFITKYLDFPSDFYVRIAVSARNKLAAKKN